MMNVINGAFMKQIYKKGTIFVSETTYICIWLRFAGTGQDFFYFYFSGKGFISFVDQVAFGFKLGKRDL